MKLYLTKIVEDRSPAVVLQALERCLKQEAWEIQRYDTQVVALGIGTSQNSVNLSDNATFEIDSSEGATTVELEAEFQQVWFLSEEAQNDKVHARFESIFSHMRATLNLAPESPSPRNEVQQQPTSPSEPTSSTDSSIAAVEFVPPSELDRNEPETAQQTSDYELETMFATSPSSPEPWKASSQLSSPPGVPRRLLVRTVSLSAAAVLVAVFILSWLSHSKAHLLSGTYPKPVPSMQSANLNASPRPHANPAPPTSTPLRKENPPYGKGRMTPSSPAPPDDPRHWLEQWAAAQRTRDAKLQASFYADEVRPYLALEKASRDVVYQSKKNDLLNRKGLWTFKIEDVSIRRQSPNLALVLLKKHFMTQRGSVKVSEQRIFSFLTLNRTQDGWRITGERDLH
jgi:ketosteroid isomerase-like protein